MLQPFGSFPQVPTMARARAMLKPRAKNSIQISHLNGGNYLSHLCYIPGYALAERQNREWRWNSKAGTPM